MRGTPRSFSDSQTVAFARLHGFPFLAIQSVLMIWCLLLSTVWAHELRPAYLELRESSAETYSVLWKVPARDDTLRLGLYVEFPQDCLTVSEPRGTIVNRAYAERWTIQRPGGLAGSSIRIIGLSGTMVDVLVRLERRDGTEQIARLTPASTSFVVEATPNTLDVAWSYAVIGVEHILSGIDHLLFILALLIITGGGWNLVKVVTAFTLSHSLTLAAATLGWVRIPLPPVEVIIALSIVFIAVEIVHQQEGRDSLTTRSPWIAAFAFGLLHGLGFSGGLSETGLPAGHIPAALLFFSVGVEMGHFLFLGVVLTGIALVRRWCISVPPWARLIPPYTIGTVAAFWVIERFVFF